MMPSPWTVLCRLLLALSLLGLDSTALADDAPAPLTADTSPAYRVARGDELNFRFVYAPELNTVVSVRPDGRVALPYAGELEVEGLTLAELQRSVQDRMAAQVRRPQVIVNVQGNTPQRVFVGGEVSRPGVQPLLGPLTALQAVMVAEGLRESAQPRDALVLRRGPNDERLVLPVDLAALMSGKEGARDVTLQPYDVVIVPRSGIASLNVWVDQYIRRALPFSMGFSYSVNRNGVVQ